MSLLANSNAIESGGYNIDRSLRFRSSASAYLSRTPASASNRTTWTWSGWVKRGALGTTTGMAYQQLFGACPASGSDATFTELVLNGNDTLQVGGWTTTWKVTTQVFRDTSAWYHFVWVLDTGNATAADRMRLYVNGSRITSFSTSNDPSLNATLGVNNNVAHALGSEQPYSSRYFDGYLAEVNFIDGQALTPSSFGQIDAVTGVWQPKKYTGTYGTNGFYLPFSDNTSATTLAYDKSGNGNNWTANNISTTSGASYDSMTDVPTLTSATAANFAVLNPLNVTTVGGNGGTFSNGNLTITSNSGTFSYKYGYSTIGVTSGKWYAEITVDTQNAATNSGLGAGSGGIVFTSSTFPSGTIVGLALDADTNELKIYKNGVLHATQSGLGSQTYHFYAGPITSGANEICQQTANFGQRPFSYAPPTGFKALNTFNLPDPTIKKPSQYMTVDTFTGDATNYRQRSVGMKPDLVWVKNRAVAWDNILGDTTRLDGLNQPILLSSNLTNAEFANGYISSTNNWPSDGYAVNGDARVNGSGNAIVSWLWKKGATPGFDIVTFTAVASGNGTFNHSLGVAPKMVILKDRTGAVNWVVYHASVCTNTSLYLNLNATSALGFAANIWGGALPTSTTVGYGAGTAVVGGHDSIAYLFAEIPGFSKFGSYTGNGSADGPFVYCGFRPKYVMVKTSTLANQPWYILDSARDIANYSTSAELYPNSSSAEVNSYKEIDLLSNGFKVRSTGTGMNSSGDIYIYAAFAENPFKYSNAR